MGHSVNFIEMPITSTKQDIENEVRNRVHCSGDGYGTAHVTFLDKVFTTEEEAANYIDTLEDSWYAGYAVRCYDTTDIKWSTRKHNLSQKLVEVREARATYLSESSVSKRSSAYITCPKCGSRLNKTYLHYNSCPCCGKDLRSETTLKRIATFDERIKKIEQQMQDETVKGIKKDTPQYWLVKYEYHV